MIGEILAKKCEIRELCIQSNILVHVIFGAEGRIGNHSHCRLLLSAKRPGLRGLHYAGSEDGISVCRTVMVGKTVGQPRADASFLKHFRILSGFSGGEGGTRTPDPVIMSHVL
jgi:hypothetical protein